MIPSIDFYQDDEPGFQGPLMGMKSAVAVVEINEKALFPFCLMKRSSLPTLIQHLENDQHSLKLCFADMHMQRASFKNRALFFHSINSFDELQQHQQLNFL